MHRSLSAGRRDTSSAEVPRPAVTAQGGSAPPVVAVSWAYRARAPKPVSGPVPDVSGSPLREAVAALHRRGYRVALHGFGAVARTLPAAGDNGSGGTTGTRCARRP